MARYYEETALIEFIQKNTPTIEGETTLNCVERAIRNAPAVDVSTAFYDYLHKYAVCHKDPAGEPGTPGEPGYGKCLWDDGVKPYVTAFENEMKRMSHKLYYYTLKYGTVEDQHAVISKVKSEVAREIFEEIEESIAVHTFTSKSEDYADGMYDAIEWVDSKIAELKKKYTEGE